jgi:hypothetical protein
MNFMTDFSKGLHILMSVVTFLWHLPVGALDSKQIHEQLRDDSDSFSKFSQDSGIDIF